MLSITSFLSSSSSLSLYPFIPTHSTLLFSGGGYSRFDRPARCSAFFVLWASGALPYMPTRVIQFNQVKHFVQCFAVSMALVLSKCPLPFISSSPYFPQVTLSFLHAMTPEWRDKHIHWFIAESPLWSGSPSYVSLCVCVCVRVCVCVCVRVRLKECVSK